MAEYTRGQDQRGSEGSGYNRKGQDAFHRLNGVDFEEMNFEQRRAPYNSNSTRSVNGEKEAGNRNSPGPGRNDL